LQQDQVRIRGHSIEARIYAEDPDRDFVPATGQLHHLALPPHMAFAVNAGGADGGEPAPVRIDGSVRPGDRVTPYYDPMIAKLIVWGVDREQALARLRGALQQTILVGLTNNVEFLHRLVCNAGFSSGRVDTGLIGREMARPTDPVDPFEPHLVAAALAHVLVEEARGQTADPWSNRQGWRLNGIAARRIWLRCGPALHEATIEYLAQGPHLASGALRAALAVDACEGTRLRLRLGERVVSADVVRHGDVLHVFAGAVHRAFALVDPVGTPGEADQDEDRLCAPMPGKIIAIHASAGDRVRRGQLLLVMEAMKMEHSIVAPHDGVLEQLRYRVGDQVEEGATLVALRAADEIPLSRAGGGADETPLSRAAGEGRGRG
jgi:3-methylcrotonyl-CoA carboxylase alpha subunit